MKKHLRLTTAAFAAATLALVGCEVDDSPDVVEDAPESVEGDNTAGTDDGDDIDVDVEGDADADGDADGDADADATDDMEMDDDE